MKRNSLYALALALAVASLGMWYATGAYRASAAAPDALPPLIEQAPAGATMIAYVDLAALRQSPLIQQLETLAKPTQVENDYKAFVDGTGFDYQRDLDRAVIASNGNAPDNVVIFAEGRFDHKKIEQYALRTGSLRQEDGRTVYVEPSTPPGKDVRFTFLAADRMALSSGGNFSALASAGAAPALDAAMRERLSRVSGAPIFAAFKTSPFAGPAGANGGAKATGVASQLQSLRWVALAAQPDAANVLLSLEGECDRPEDAQRVASSLELMRALFQGALADPKNRNQMPAQSSAAFSKLLDSAKVSTDAARVRLLVTLTPDVLKLQSPVAPAPAAH